MTFNRARLPIALAIISVFMAFASSASAAQDPGTVEFYPPSGTFVLHDPPTAILWREFGDFTSATCAVSKLSPTTATPYPAASCATVMSHSPVVDNAAAPSSVGYTWDMTPFATSDGVYRLTYTVNFTSYPPVTATRDFTIDTSDPSLTASAPMGISNDNTPQITYDAVDTNLDWVHCKLDPTDLADPNAAATYPVCPASPFSLSPLPDGDHTYYVIARDKAGNADAELLQFTIDATGPAIIVSGVSEGEVLTSAYATISVSTTDAVTGVSSTSCSYDSVAPSGCSDPAFVNPPLADGAHTLHVSATDLAGNVSSRAINFSVDTTGGLKQGLVAPKTAKFTAKRGKLKGTKYPTTVSVSFALAAGAPKTACSGSAKINVLVGKKQIGSASAKFKLIGAKCVATGKPKISKKFKGKKAKIAFAYKSGPIKAFTLYGSAKL
jgi:hypothetical protein